MIKLTRMVPWVGAAFALATLASTMQRKGILRGALDAALDATPVLGGVKLLAERMRGRDFIGSSGRRPPGSSTAIQNPPAAAVRNSTSASPG